MSEQKLNQLLQTICDILQVKIEDVKSQSRKAHIIDVRTIFVAKSSPYFHHERYAAAKIMPVINRDRTMFYATIQRYLDLLQFNDPFLKKVKQVECALKELQSVAA